MSAKETKQSYLIMYEDEQGIFYRHGKRATGYSCVSAPTPRIKEGTRVLILEDNGRLILQPLTQDSIARARGCLAGGPSLLKALLEDRRQESAHEQQKEKRLIRMLTKSRWS